jgi:hypothetical protein
MSTEAEKGNFQAMEQSFADLKAHDIDRRVDLLGDSFVGDSEMDDNVSGRQGTRQSVDMLLKAFLISRPIP